MHRISRRHFVALASAGAAAPFALPRAAFAAPVTAQEIVERIKKSIGAEWKTDTVDGFKAGDPSTIATAVVTTALATIDVLEQAVRARANLVITCEPTFYSRADTPAPPKGGPDPVFAAKAELIASNNLVVWRFSDHWKLRKPDPFASGLVDALGWSKFRDPDDDARVSIPGMRLDALAAAVGKALDTRGGMRVIGNPQTRVQTIAVLPGVTPIQASLRTLPGADAIVAGEVREWESVEYVRDTVTEGGRKGLILVGRIVSEEPGMKACARWLGRIVPELTTTWIPAGDPYWRPR